jgi:hypothetical protein
MEPEKSDQAQSRSSVVIGRAAFFPPGLDPVLDRRVGDEHAVIASEAPTGRARREAILEDRPNGGVDDASGGVTAGVGQIGVEVLATASAGVRRGDPDAGAGPPGERIAQVVTRASGPPIRGGAGATARAGPPAGIAARAAHLARWGGRGQLLHAVDPLGGIRSGFAGSCQGAPPGRKGSPRNSAGRCGFVHGSRPVTLRSRRWCGIRG